MARGPSLFALWALGLPRPPGSARLMLVLVLMQAACSQAQTIEQELFRITGRKFLRREFTSHAPSSDERWASMSANKNARPAFIAPRST